MTTKMPAAWLEAKAPTFKPRDVAIASKVLADAIPKWWRDMPEEGKEEYVAEHPGSKYADIHTQEKKAKGETPQPAPPAPKAETPETPPKAEPEKKAPDSHPALQQKQEREQQRQDRLAKLSPEHREALQEHIKLNEALKKKGGKGTAEEWAAYDAALGKLEKLNDEEEARNAKSGGGEKPKAPAPSPSVLVNHPAVKSPGKRKAVAGFIKKKSGHIFSHLKKTGVEWKTAGGALKNLAKGGSLRPGDKHALGAVATDIALVMTTVLAGGGAAHGVLAFFKHFGMHMAQDALIKAAMMGATIGHADHHDEHGEHDAHGEHGQHAPQHASAILAADDEMERVVKKALELMMEAYEKGDLSKYVKQAEAKEQGRAGGTSRATQQRVKSALEARVDMSAEVVGRGLCPVCAKPMVRAMASGNMVMVCAADRISLPIENEQV